MVAPAACPFRILPPASGRHRRQDPERTQTSPALLFCLVFFGLAAFLLGLQALFFALGANLGSLTIHLTYGRLTQRLECHPHTVEVTGSNPVPPN